MQGRWERRERDLWWGKGKLKRWIWSMVVESQELDIYHLKSSFQPSCAKEALIILYQYGLGSLRTFLTGFKCSFYNFRLWQTHDHFPKQCCLLRREKMERRGRQMQLPPCRHWDLCTCSHHSTARLCPPPPQFQHASLLTVLTGVRTPSHQAHWPSPSFLYSNHSHLALPFLASMLLWLPKELALPSMMNLCTEREQSGLWQCVSSTLLTHHIAIDIAITAIHWPYHLGFIILKRPWVLGRHCYPYCFSLISEETKA